MDAELTNESRLSCDRYAKQGLQIVVIQDINYGSGSACQRIIKNEGVIYELDISTLCL